jgi:branched-chain amino acid transport system permease protein
VLFLSELISGIILGSAYGTIAVGLTYTLGLARIFNFAYGTFYVFAAFAIIKFNSAPGGYLTASILAILAVAVGGVAFAVVIIFPTLRRGGLTVMVATLGVDIALTNYAQDLFGPQTQFVSSPLTQDNIHISGLLVNAQDILTVVGAFAITGALSWFILKTKRGAQLRAAAENSDLAAASGINIRQSYTLAVIIGILVAALGAVFYAPLTVVTTTSGDQLLLIAFAVIAFAGVGRLWGALVVGIAIGVFDSLFVAYVNATLAEVIVYLGLILLLIVKPRGIFGGYA